MWTRTPFFDRNEPTDFYSRSQNLQRRYCVAQRSESGERYIARRAIEEALFCYRRRSA